MPNNTLSHTTRFIYSANRSNFSTFDSSVDVSVVRIAALQRDPTDLSSRIFFILCSGPCCHAQRVCEYF